MPWAGVKPSPETLRSAFPGRIMLGKALRGLEFDYRATKARRRLSAALAGSGSGVGQGPGGPGGPGDPAAGDFFYRRVKIKDALPWDT